MGPGGMEKMWILGDRLLVILTPPPYTVAFCDKMQKRKKIQIKLVNMLCSWLFCQDIASSCTLSQLRTQWLHPLCISCFLHTSPTPPLIWFGKKRHWLQRQAPVYRTLRSLSAEHHHTIMMYLVKYGPLFMWSPNHIRACQGKIPAFIWAIPLKHMLSVGNNQL